jgi:hypothetical protein
MSALGQRRPNAVTTAAPKKYAPDRDDRPWITNRVRGLGYVKSQLRKSLLTSAGERRRRIGAADVGEADREEIARCSCDGRRIFQP